MIGNKRERSENSSSDDNTKTTGSNSIGVKLTHDKSVLKGIDMKLILDYDGKYYLRSCVHINKDKIPSLDGKSSKTKTKVSKNKGKSVKKTKSKTNSIYKRKEKTKKEKACRSSSSAPKKSKSFTMMTSKTKIVDEDCKEFLNGKCDKLFCDRIHNHSLKFKDENNEEFSRRYNTINQDFSMLEPYHRKLYGNSTLDLMFLVDCTGSMGCWITAVKNELYNIINFIKSNNPYSTIRVSFVGYRDFDCKRIEERYPTINFTEDIDKVKNFISNVQAMGGADGPEDVAGGLKMGLEQEWSENSAKYCVLVCDAPCHGITYHDQHNGDYYPDGCPNKLTPEDLIKQYAERNVTFYAVKLTNETDKMFKIFSDSYRAIIKQPIIISELGHSTTKFAFMIAVGANETLSSMTVNNISLREFLNEINKEGTLCLDTNGVYQTKLNDFMNRIADSEANKESLNKGGMIQSEEGQTVLELKLSTSPTYSSNLKAICHSFYIKKDRYTNINWKNPFIQNSHIESTVQIANDPFAMGCMRFAFHMKDTDLNQELVGKIPQKYYPCEYTVENLSKELETITICHHIANDFNERIVNIVPDTRLLLNFIHCYIYEILDPEYKYKYFTVENYINGDYVKYNNNAGWIAQNVTDQTLVAQAFSHFSWQVTKGYLLVVDLQGVGGYLTDPQIHCLNQRKFGKGNFGYAGMIKFFMSHNCNSYCRRLNLIHPKDKVDIGYDYDFFVDKYVLQESDSHVYKLCDLCRNPFKACSKHLYTLKKKCWEAFCDDCEQKRKQSFKGATCISCKSFFKSAEYIYKMKRLPFPEMCMKCRQLNVNKEREEHSAAVVNQEEEDC